jgi:hypothetical protein
MWRWCFRRCARRQTAGPRNERAHQRWEKLSADLCDAVQTEAREFIVRRARQIWGRLGQKLQKNWAKKYRADHLTSFYMVKSVKQWRPKEQQNTAR